MREGGGLPAVEEWDCSDLRFSPESSMVSKDVISSVLSLPEAQRSVVGLVYIEGYSYREAASILDIPVGTVMSRLSVARRKLAKQLTPYQRHVV